MTNRFCIPDFVAFTAASTRFHTLLVPSPGLKLTMPSILGPSRSGWLPVHVRSPHEFWPSNLIEDLRVTGSVHVRLVSQHGGDPPRKHHFSGGALWTKHRCQRLSARARATRFEHGQRLGWLLLMLYDGDWWCLNHYQLLYYNGWLIVVHAS